MKTKECEISERGGLTARAIVDRPSSLRVAPVTIRAAKGFIEAHHRHHRAPAGAIFAVALAREGELVGVAMVGRPVARVLADGATAEVTRVCVLPDHPNACSMLYGAARRAVRAMGYRRLITYTLPEEGGASLRASGWRCVGEAGGGTWSRRGRERLDDHPTGRQLCWECELAP